MKNNLFTAEYYFNLACRTFGLEDEHTIAISKILDCKKAGYLEADYADSLAKLLFHDGRILWAFQEEADEPLEYTEPNEDEDFDGFVDDVNESGFDPYMGCYTGDC